MMVHICSPITCEMEAIQGGVQGYPWLNLGWSSALGTKDCLGKKKWEEGLE